MPPKKRYARRGTLYLRTVADRLESGDDLVLESGSESVMIELPNRPTFEVKAERETSRSGGPAEFSVEFELEWDEGDGENGSGDSLLIS
ncbi:amphi-Trp domain-containing protein [Natronosalvus caseinilyticus]|uniref:amphi-Trp domain-containing protein n=1 Tax=Natronosalvus caseinilyticus TaxID=2953747 RepID=UPI0028ABCAFE|nr:amphi-Trp domain-containing protein [Natronosalvus caseinilyticus]